MPSTGKRTRRSRRNLTATSSQSSNSAETIGRNEDPLLLILILLPIKSLLKFKCVSKQWLSLISNPDFSRRIKTDIYSVSGIFFRRNCGNANSAYDFIDLSPATSQHPPFRTLSFVNDAIKILESCHGLLLCRSFLSGNRKINYYVYNPTTKQYTVFPPLQDDSTSVVSMNLAFDPSKSPEYKVICVRNYDLSRNQYKIEIYSSKKGIWRDVNDPLTAPNGDVLFNKGVFWNARINWISEWEDKGLCFDVYTERFGEMPMPPRPYESEDGRGRYFGESRGHLHIVESFAIDSWDLAVYEMESDYSRWFFKYRVKIDYNKRDFGIKGELPILSIFREEREEDSYMLLIAPGQTLCYHFKENCFYKLYNFGTDKVRQYGNYHLSFRYIQSLACV
ncbi:F-box protein At5g07610-like [Rutidosis leptorrhynchoides]|uniref:F-box protein At5g07610-like n=1 Tax=Rutidosis leptorrhynchoides TaxID=125765 RepID=UPI003A98E1E9